MTTWHRVPSFLQAHSEIHSDSRTQCPTSSAHRAEGWGGEKGADRSIPNTDCKVGQEEWRVGRPCQVGLSSGLGHQGPTGAAARPCTVHPPRHPVGLPQPFCPSPTPCGLSGSADGGPSARRRAGAATGRFPAPGEQPLGLPQVGSVCRCVRATGAALLPPTPVADVFHLPLRPLPLLVLLALQVTLLQVHLPG